MMINPFLFLNPFSGCTTCKQMFFLEASSQICKPCLENCKTCQNNYQCLTCLYSGSSRFPPDCLIQSCLANQYIIMGYCGNCMTVCSTCTNGISCTACKNPENHPPYCSDINDNCLLGQFFNAALKKCE